MQSKKLKFMIASAALSCAFSASAAPLFFQGSSDPSLGKSVAQARADWEAELSSFTNDTLAGISGSVPFTFTVGNVYTQTGNGSTISAVSGPAIRGSRNGASRIEFLVTFPSFVNAVGFDVFDNDGGGMNLLLTDAFTGVVSTFSFNSTPGSGDTEFFGVVFEPTTFISALQVSGTDPGGITTWDNFATGVGRNVVVNPNNPVPAPGTLLLVTLGLAALTRLRGVRTA